MRHSRTAGRAPHRGAGAATLLALAAALFACAAATPPARLSRAELLRRFESGRVRLDCARCRFDFRAAEWLLEQGEYEQLVVEILSSGDGSGRSWYLLGRAAEATERRELAIGYYQQALATPRNPILPLWPLYEDLNYRVRRLATRPVPQAAAPPRASASRELELEQVTTSSLVVSTRPGVVGAFVEKLSRGDGVEVIDRSGDWEQVRLADGRVGWVWGAYTTPAGRGPVAEVATAASPAPRRPAKAAARAKTRARAPKAAKAPAPAARPAQPELAEPPAPEAAQELAVAQAPAPAAKPAEAKAPAAEPAPPTLAATAPRPARTPTSRAIASLIASLPSSEPPPPPSSLASSGDAGILGCPLPRGAELSGRTHGAAGTDDHPTETYAIDAPAKEIVGFYEREMQRAGWRKSFAASEFLLYFEKDDRTVGVLIERKGGTFTLMGS